MSIHKDAVDRKEAVERAHHHLKRSSDILEAMGKAGDEGAAVTTEMAMYMLATAQAEASTGHGWALLATVPRTPVMRGEP